MFFLQSQPGDTGANDPSAADDSRDSDKSDVGNETEPEVDPEPIVPAIRRVNHASAPGGMTKTCGSEVSNRSGSSVIETKSPVVRSEKL